MRDLTEEELASLDRGFCPYCDSPDFYPGPQGAASRNYFCIGCGAGFNVLDAGVAIAFGASVGMMGGQLIKEPDPEHFRRDQEAMWERLHPRLAEQPKRRRRWWHLRKSDRSKA